MTLTVERGCLNMTARVAAQEEVVVEQRVSGVLGLGLGLKGYNLEFEFQNFDLGR